MVYSFLYMSRKIFILCSPYHKLHVTLLWLSRLCHINFALQHHDVGVYTSFRVWKSMALHLLIFQQSSRPCTSASHTAIAYSYRTSPVVALIRRGILGRKLKDYPGSDNFFPVEQNSSHCKQSSSAWETTWGRPNQKLRLAENPALLLQMLSTHP